MYVVDATGYVVLVSMQNEALFYRPTHQVARWLGCSYIELANLHYVDMAPLHYDFPML